MSHARNFLRNPMGYARGRNENELLKIAVAFERDVFDAIRQEAAARRVSFAEQVRCYVDWGMESAEAQPKPPVALP